MSNLEKPSSWVDPEGKETKEAQNYMKKLQELKKDVFKGLIESLKSQNLNNTSYDFEGYKAQSGDTIGAILKNKINAFGKNRDLLLLSLTHMNINQGANINILYPGETVTVENGLLIIKNKSGTVRLSAEILPWGEIGVNNPSKPAEPKIGPPLNDDTNRPEDTGDTGGPGKTKDDGIPDYVPGIRRSNSTGD